MSVAVLLVGLFITYGLYHSKHQQELRNAQLEFKQLAIARVRDIEAEFKRSYFQVASIANLFSSSDWVSQAEFTEFVERVFPIFPKGRRISMIAHIHQDALDDYISNLKRNNAFSYADFAVFDHINGQKVMPPSVHNQHYNFIVYGFPTPKINDFYGRNIRPDSPIGPKLHTVLQSQAPYISGISMPIEGIVDKPFFIYIHPFVKKEKNGSTSLAGVIVSSQYVEDVMASQVIQESVDLFSFQIIDNLGNMYRYPENSLQVSTSAKQSATLQSDNNESKSDIAKTKTVVDKTHNPFVFSESLDLVGNRWQLKITPNYQLGKKADEVLLSILLLGSIVSVFSAVFVHLMLSQKYRLESLVASKTAQLSEKNKLLKSAVVKAEKSAQIKAEFLANMSHEIRTPLNGIYGFAQLLRHSKLDSKQSGYVDRMELSAKHLMTVINDILDFSKIESGNLELESRPISIIKIIDFLYASFENAAQEAGIEFTVKLSEIAEPDLLGDEVRLNQILLNLCSNAIKFTHKGRVEVTINMHATQTNSELQEVEFSVKDTGIGMKPESLKNLFQAFTQADTSTTRKFGGTGLGLTISQQLCKLMGGKIIAQSQEGVGSTFTAIVRLKRNTNVVQQDLANKTFNKTVSVLLIEDNHTALEVLDKSLTKMKAQVTSTLSAKYALQQLKQAQAHFDLILLDWTMSEMDGKAFIQSALALNLARLPKIIVISAYDLNVIQSAAMDLPISAILQKPCLESRLFDVIANTVAIGGAGRKPESDVCSLSGLDILVAEDNEINQLLVKTMLTNQGVNVDVVENGQQCIELLEKKHNYDVILMDIHMPVLDGLEATKIIRQNHNKTIANIPIIALTANVVKEDVETYIANGINAHAAKPIEFSQLKQIIVEQIAQQ
ncbi:response regulator [Catenovulum sediminis]|uniref:histidine kinase n=1 Tax=Catenovulum sediminis TaxID=1740262 RepID=A0ABV1RDT3_9ALTE